jgi:hypothetical protein
MMQAIESVSLIEGGPGFGFPSAGLGFPSYWPWFSVRGSFEKLPTALFSFRFS